ncbi:cytochrome P450 [Wolfiporia cocos MD-104 SS10]|uniref:Cytochrome P450 n=1 Tax=Wolfiporia cocos (strain MD-104) TaxID=742152 RepID=A0A2H3IZK8_WOLCO|nr:cytochrome P450 [Wolfiporia cocos MD-104 SS10]
MIEVSSYSYGFACFLFLIAVRSAWLAFFDKRWRALPPAPSTNIITGNIHKLPLKNAWVRLTEYKKQYGDLVFFHGLGNNILVLNSAQSINDLLEKRSRNYSHRPIFTVAGELMALGQSVPLLPYGEEWRAHRKLAHTALSPTAVKKYHIIQEDFAALLCNDLLSKPEDFFSLVRLTAGRIILTVTYGISIGSFENEYITHAEDTMQVISRATVPGAYFCDLLPWMKYLPSWLPFQREAKMGKEMIERLVAKPFDAVKLRMRSGDAEKSLTYDLLSIETKDDERYEDRVKWMAGAMYGGERLPLRSTHLYLHTYATVLTFIMAMALHPDKQAKAQAEIDAVVGSDRMPAMTDLSALPYVNAVIKETMRWHPVLPLSQLSPTYGEDDNYCGYFIPAGTIVMPNVWAIAFEPNDKYNPQEFIPERFFDSTQNIVEPSTYSFGFGRRLVISSLVTEGMLNFWIFERICPGKLLGENSVFILITSILASFNIAPPKDDILTVDFAPDLVSYPKPFKCSITPRSSNKENLVKLRATRSQV